MWWHVHRLGKILEKRKNQIVCERCGLLFDKSLDECDRCANINDDELQKLLAHRAKARIGMGRKMFAGAVIVFFLMLLINGII